MSYHRKNKHYLNMPHSKNNNPVINVANRFLTSSNPLLGPVVRGVKKTAKNIRNRMKGSRKGGKKMNKTNKKYKKNKTVRLY
jgi:hypothetical protein